MSICREIKKRIEKQLPSILEIRNRRKMKGDGTYVTRGDLLCDKIIFDYVRSLPEQFEIVSEEKRVVEFFYDPNKNYIVVDPIDGTENFTSGLKEWGVSVCAYKQGTHAESMLIMPELGFSLITGDKIKKNQSRIHGLSSSLSREHFRNLKDGLEYRIMGCAVYNFYNVIMKSYLSLENPRGARSWDILAGLNLAREHGLRVTVNGKKYRGEFLDPKGKYPFKVEHAHTKQR